MDENAGASRKADPTRDPYSALAGRRKIRGGTRSCHECKRRKAKCQFLSRTDTACVNCRRRGTPCVSQEFEGDASDIPNINPIVRVESLLQKVLQRLEGQQQVSPDSGVDLGQPLSTPRPPVSVGETPEGPITLDTSIISVSPALSAPDAPPNTSSPTASPKHTHLSRTLYAALPSTEFLDVLRQASRTVPIPFYLMNTRSHTELERDGVDIHAKLAAFPTPDMHPVLLTRQMLIFASLLQHLRPKQLSQLPEDPQTVALSLVSTATNAFTKYENLFGSAEGLECIILKGTYESNYGNIRQSWLTFRKGVAFAQLLGMHRPNGPLIPTLDPSTKVRRDFIWYRLVHMDRFLSLMLGLPQGSNDMSMVSDAALTSETPIGRLERIQTGIACRILQRNESSFFHHDYTATRQMDNELVKAASALPSRFWLIPTFVQADRDPNLDFWDIMRLTVHLVHFNLLCQLHLPFLLCPTTDRAYEFSMMACANASREILSRFNTYTNLNRFSNMCRRVDLFALFAAMTLLFTHISSHRRRTGDNLLTHHRLQDHATASQFLEIMEDISSRTSDELGKRAVSLVRCLLAIGARAANGDHYTVRTVQWVNGSPPSKETIRISIPYFSIVEISRVGDGLEGGHVQPHGPEAAQAMESTALDNHVSSPLAWDPFSQGTAHRRSSGLQQLSGSEDVLPGLIAGLDDWGLQGVDMAFFDTLTWGVHEQADMQNDLSF